MQRSGRQSGGVEWQMHESRCSGCCLDVPGEVLLDEGGRDSLLKERDWGSPSAERDGMAMPSGGPALARALEGRIAMQGPLYQQLGHEASGRPSAPWWQTHIGLVTIAVALPVGLLLVFLRRDQEAAATTTPGLVQYTTAAPGDPCSMGPCSHEFYMYRAQSENNYAMQNVNTASLAGVMWYLHNEIVQSVPRKYDVSRIMRLKMTMKNPQAWWDAHHTQFGQYVAFDQAKCTVPNCQDIWDTYGAVIGCQAPNPDVANYRSFHQTILRCDNGHCDAPIWYSLPGPCPSMYFGQKTPACIDQFPGGFCFSSYNETTGLGTRTIGK
jgi:hypothetical protein